MYYLSHLPKEMVSINNSMLLLTKTGFFILTVTFMHIISKISNFFQTSEVVLSLKKFLLNKLKQNFIQVDRESYENDAVFFTITNKNHT